MKLLEHILQTPFNFQRAWETSIVAQSAGFIEQILV